MSDITLPKEWRATQLGDVAEYGKTQKCELSDIKVDTWILELEDIEKNSSRIIKRLNTSERPFKSTKNKFKEGDILYGKLRPYLNKVVIADDNGVCSTEIIPLNAEPNVNNHYLFHWLRSETFLNYVVEVSYGVNMPRLGTKDGLLAPFILPPLAEQKIIADKLDTLLAQVETSKARLERIPQILKTFRQSVLAAAVSGKLTEEWRLEKANENLTVFISEVKNKRKEAWVGEQVKAAIRKGATFNVEKIAQKYKEPTDQSLDEFDLTTIKHIPKEWLSTNLDSVSVAVTGKTPKTTEDSYWDGEIPFISPSQITKGGSLTSPERYVTNEGANKTTILPSGSIMIVCIGTIGKVGLVDKEVSFNQQINALIPTKVILPKFLFFWSQTLHSWLNKTSSAVVNAAIINKSRLCSAPCPLPSIEEQTHIVHRVEELFAFADSIEQKANVALERVNNLTQAILAKAFRGELTADWRAANPELISGDNSAEALLEKIKAEREALSSKKKPKKKIAARKKA